jgi:hypothetical protein
LKEIAVSDVLGPIDVRCDAPRYAVVQACHQLGLQCPEDVRWCRIKYPLGQDGGWSKFVFKLWKRFVWSSIRLQKTCTCGQEFPALKKVTFTFNTGAVESYLLGQCQRCRTIFWEEI